MQHHGGLADTGTGGQYGEVARMPASGCFVELVQPGCDAGGFAFCCGFDPLGIGCVYVVAYFLNGFCAVVGGEVGGDGVYGFAGVVEQVGYVDGLVGG